MDREQLLQYFYGLPTDRLDNLKKFSGVLLLPEEDLLTNATMVQMLTKSFELADTHFPTWTDRTHSDFGRFLVELFCLFSEKDFQYINLFGRELQLDSMSLYSNAYMRALELGNTPQLFKAATGHFDLTFQAGAATIIAEGRINIKRDDKVFTNVEPVTVAGSLTDSIVNVMLHCGNYVNKTSEFGGRPLNYLDGNVDVSTVRVLNSGVYWSKVLRFGVSMPTQKVWFALPEENGTFSIVFGNGVHGVLPNTGDMFDVSYLSGEIVTINLGILPCTVSESVPSRPLSTVVQTSNIEQSVLQDSLNSIKASSPLIFKTRQRIINETDCQNLLNAMPLIRKSKCVFWQDSLYFYVIPSDGLVPTQAFLDDLAVQLDGNQILGYTVLGLATTFIDITPLNLDVYALRGSNLQDLAVNVYANVSEYLNPLHLAEYGADFNYVRFASHVISNVTGVQNVVVKLVKGVVPMSQGYETVNQAEITKPLPTPSGATVTQLVDGVKYERGGVTINMYYVN
jgi:hypothetical protein